MRGRSSNVFLDVLSRVDKREDIPRLEFESALENELPTDRAHAVAYEGSTLFSNLMKSLDIHL